MAAVVKGALTVSTVIIQTSAVPAGKTEVVHG